jgi:hypothetical protein
MLLLTLNSELSIVKLMRFLYLLHMIYSHYNLLGYIKFWFQIEYCIVNLFVLLNWWDVVMEFSEIC